MCVCVGGGGVRGQHVPYPSIPPNNVSETSKKTRTFLSRHICIRVHLHLNNFRPPILKT